jgi:hypothetical protein
MLNHTYTDVLTEIRYNAGETKTTEFDLYGHLENTPRCLVPGTYPIKTPYNIADDADTDDPDWEYRWGIGITIEES